MSDAQPQARACYDGTGKTAHHSTREQGVISMGVYFSDEQRRANAAWLSGGGSAAAGGDRDTICTIVGGILACRVGLAGIPIEWRRATEPWDE